MPMPDCEVLIAGGGPAGFASAIALSERGVSTIIVDPDQPTPALSRCEMLPPAAQNILERLGLKDTLRSAVPLEGVVSLWGSATPIDHAAEMPNLGHNGWSVDRTALDTLLRDRAAGLDITAVTGRVRTITGQSGAWRIDLQDGTRITAGFIVDATGRPAVLARKLGANVQFGPQLIATTCNIATKSRHSLLIEACAHGWWYALPRAGQGSSVGFMSSAPLPGDTADALIQEARDLDLLSAIAAPQNIATADSRMARLTKVADRGWLATGDAACAFDPIASQGLFNALSGGFFAGNAAADALCGDDSAGATYAAMIMRTAGRTHRLTPHQYAARPFATKFWETHAAHHVKANQHAA